jgi:2-iminobutanoate/2-iminopropanoate deaminase
MEKRSVDTIDAPAAIGPYSQAVQHGNLLWCSGQLGLRPNDGSLVEGVRTQAEQALINLETICREADTSLERALRLTIYLLDLADFAVVNEVYARHFEAPFPTRACVQVAALPKNALVEIDAVVAMP